jgi:hypothetical protein
MNEIFKSENEVVFDFIPFNEKLDDPEIGKVTQVLSFNEVVAYSYSHSNVLELGLFIAHSKFKSSGFIRYIIISISPILVSASTFDENFKLINKLNDFEVDLTNDFGISLMGTKKGVNLLKRNGAIDSE